MRTSDALDIGILSACHVTGGVDNRIASQHPKNIPGDGPIGLHYVADVTVAECNNVVDASHSTLCTDPPTFMLMDGTVVTDTEACSSHAWVGVSVFMVVALAVLTPDQSRP